MFLLFLIFSRISATWRQTEKAAGNHRRVPRQDQWSECRCWSRWTRAPWCKDCLRSGTSCSPFLLILLIGSSRPQFAFSFLRPSELQASSSPLEFPGVQFWNLPPTRKSGQFRLMLTHLNLAEGRHNVFQLKCFSLAGKCPKMVHFCKQNIESVLCQKKT